MHPSPGPHPSVPDVLYEDTVEYVPIPQSVRIARYRVERLARGWELPPWLVGDAGLVVSELASNALLHGCVNGRLFRVRAALTVALLRIEVSDPCGERRPSPRAPGVDEQFGRGLLIVAACAARWGSVEEPAGKLVWAELDRVTPTAQADRPAGRGAGVGDGWAAHRLEA